MREDLSTINGNLTYQMDESNRLRWSQTWMAETESCDRHVMDAMGRFADGLDMEVCEEGGDRPNAKDFVLMNLLSDVSIS